METTGTERVDRHDETFVRDKTAPPCIVVIFGASGDLTKRKLVPALFNLSAEGLTTSTTQVVGYARHDSNDASFRTAQREACAKFSRTKPTDESWAKFEPALTYVRGGYDDLASFEKLGKHLADIDARNGTAGNRLFYLATPPESFAPIVEMLGAAKLLAPKEDRKRFTRIVIEKPFGVDLASSRELDTRIKAVASESQVFRIDHYLGKEAVQNLLAFRFANSFLLPLWHRDHIDHVQITVAEDLGLEGRGRYYDNAGVVRDVVQNHALQLLMLLAMEPPNAFDARSVRDEKVRVLSAVRSIVSDEDVKRFTVRGQYAAGTIVGKSVPAYRDEPDVAKGTETETFAAMRLMIDSWRWGGVPFYIRAGKRLAQRVTEITIQFREIPLRLFGGPDHGPTPNVLVIRVQPHEGITLTISSKIPGAGMQLRPVDLAFDYEQTYGRSAPEAYERLILDAMHGDATLFARNDEVDVAWQIITPIMEGWARASDKTLETYDAGTWGPKCSDALLARDGRTWRSPKP